MASSNLVRVWVIACLLSYVCPLLSCPCNTSGIQAFSVVSDQIGVTATAKCCAQDGYVAGVNLLRENSDPEEVISYIPRQSNCEGLVFSMVNVPCSSRLICHSVKVESDENKVIVSVGSLISCANPPSNAVIDALQHCPCPPTVASTWNPSTASSAEEEERTTSISNKSAPIVATKPNNGNSIPTLASAMVASLLIVTTVVVAVIAIVVKRWRNGKKKEGKLEVAVQAEQEERLKLMDYIRNVFKFGQLHANSSQVDTSTLEANGGTAAQQFNVTMESDISIPPPTASQDSVEVDHTQCTSNVSDIGGALFCNGVNLMSLTSGSGASGATCITDEDRSD